MTIRTTIITFLFLVTYWGKSQDRKLPDTIKTTACFKTNSSISPTNEIVPQVNIKTGSAIVFDFGRIKGYDRQIINGDTITWADTDFFERVTFQIKTKSNSFLYSGDSLKLINGFYEFHGGESPLANTDFKIKRGFVKGYKSNGNWIVEVLVAVVDKDKPDKIVREIKFSSTFKNCN